MKLITHNLLSCHIKGVKNGFPFKIEADKVDTCDADFDPAFLRHMFPKIEWEALVEGAKALGVEDLPVSASAEDLDNDEFLQAFHHALLEVTLEEGNLVCPETGRKFSVHKGIPNMLLNEDEC